MIKGRLVGVRGDTYVIDSSNLGEIQVKISTLESITNDAAEASMQKQRSTQDNSALSTSSQQMQQQIQTMQQKMLADPEITSALQDLASDPEIQKIVQDPTLLQSALSMDPRQIQGNPAAQKLLEHPKMQRVMELMQKKMLLPETSPQGN